MHCPCQSSQKKNSKCFPKADFYQGCQEVQKIRSFKWEGGVIAAQLFPKLLGQLPVFECWSGFKEQGQPSTFQ